MLDGKIKKLQNEGLGKTDQASPLTTEEISQILNNEIKFKDISHCNDNGLYLTFNHENNNQRGALKHFDDIQYEEFNYFPKDTQNYIGFEADDYDRGIV
ncbi:11052_t:CDS:2 [Gigaspora rosea]|nr:11052_t:CDS:2 [Gigaspora rosea]